MIRLVQGDILRGMRRIPQLHAFTRQPIGPSRRALDGAIWLTPGI